MAAETGSPFCEPVSKGCCEAIHHHGCRNRQSVLPQAVQFACVFASVPLIFEVRGKSPMSAVTDLLGDIKRLSLSESPILRGQSNARKNAFCASSGKSP